MRQLIKRILREQLIESIDEIQGTPLYHHTTESRALSIMNSDMMKGTRPDDDIIAVDQTLSNTPHQSMVSFTRDKNFIPDQSIGASIGGDRDASKLKVIFVVDKDKLRTNYKVVPFDYGALEDRWYEKEKKEDPETNRQPRAPREGKNKEYEERVLTNKIQPLRRYITDIIYKGDNPVVQQKINEYLGKEKQEESEGVGAYAAPAFEMKPDHEHFKHQYNEEEITERCWKGYTQKGMKTMFGKRYPNCVKIKKKGVNESKIVDYLKQFVDFKNDDPKKQFQKVVDVITKITLKDNPVNEMIGVAVTHVNKEMWGQNFNDSESIGTKWNFKVIIRPLFHKHIADMDNKGEVSKQLLQFEDEFLKSAKGMGFELISPVTHKEIDQYNVKFEFAHLLVVK